MSGKVYLVGAGPGDPELLTLKAKKIIENSDVIIYDNLVAEDIVNLSTPFAKLIFAGKRAGNHFLKQYETNNLLIKYAKTGFTVCRLKGGDPLIFARGGEEVQALTKENISYEIVPGITSAVAAPVYAGIFPTHRDFASSFSIFSGHRRQDGTDFLPYDNIQKTNATNVFLMSVENLDIICKKLMSEGFEKDTPVMVIEKGTTPKQRSICGTLENIFENLKAANISFPALTVVGKTAGKIYPWYNGGNGVTCIVTGSRQYSKKLSFVLKSHGFDARQINLIHTKKLDLKPIPDFSKYSVIVLTSANGVDAFFEYIKENNIDIRNVINKKFAVIGPGTSKKLREYGIFEDIMPEIYTSKCLGEALLKKVKKCEKIACFRSKNGSSEIYDIIKSDGFDADVFYIYETKTTENRKELLNRSAKTADYIILSSASGAKAFSKLFDENTGAKIISIGPVTSAAAKNLGIKVYAQAKEQTNEGIAKCIEELESKKVD